MATTLKTTTRTVTLSLVDPKSGLDWSGDYVGNHSDSALVRDPDGAVDYLTDDATADWWLNQCAAQQEADNALAELSADGRQSILDDVGGLDLEDQPGAILEAIRNTQCPEHGCLRVRCAESH